ncbi:MAG TPA: hypothetical protein VGR26_00040 [Acidimicrobiales bacterium]|nr:hypothetical protein [Acidimicrobiales bacterium]
MDNPVNEPSARRRRRRRRGHSQRARQQTRLSLQAGILPGTRPGGRTQRPRHRQRPRLRLHLVSHRPRRPPGGVGALRPAAARRHLRLAAVLGAGEHRRAPHPPERGHRARSAVEHLPLPGPEVATNPDAGHDQLVGVPTSLQRWSTFELRVAEGQALVVGRR